MKLFFMAEKIPVYMYNTFSLHSPLLMEISWFCNLGTVNKMHIALNSILSFSEA